MPSELRKVTDGSVADLADHRSRRLSPALVESAQLVVTMTRQHLVDVILLAADAWPRCFTLAELLRRARTVGPRRRGQSLPAWVDEVQAGRSRAGILSLDLADDVADPMGGRRSAFERTVAELDAATAEMAALVYPPGLDLPSPSMPSA